MDLVRLEILLDIIAWVLDRRKHFGQIGLEYISMWLAALLKYHRIQVPWSRYQAMKGETEKRIYLFRLTHAGRTNQSQSDVLVSHSTSSTCVSF